MFPASTEVGTISHNPNMTSSLESYYIIIFLLLAAATAQAQDSTQADVVLDSSWIHCFMDLNPARYSTGLLINKGTWTFTNLPGYAEGADAILSPLS